MSSLLAVLLVGTSSLGSHLIYSFPPSPVAVPRRSKPIYSTRNSQRNSKSSAPGPALDSDTASTSSSSDSDDSDDEDDDLARKADEHNDGDKYLAFERTTLASLLSPNRELCDQPFELVLDHLAFVGHPVWLGTEESRPAAAEESEEADRGRPGQPRRPNSAEGLHASLSNFQLSREPSPGTPILSPADSPPPSPRRTPIHSPSSLSASHTIDFTPSSHQSHGSGSVQNGSGRMSSFNFVCVIDTPPDGHLSSHLEGWYNDVVIPMTANIKALERRENWLGRQAGKIRRSKDNFGEKGLSVADHIAALPSLSTLAAALSQLYTSLKDKSAATIKLDTLTVQVRLRGEVPLDLGSSFLDRGGRAIGDAGPSGSRPPSPARIAQKAAPLFSRARRRQKVTVRPWQTLLPLEDTEEMKDEVEEGTLLWRFLDICSPTLSFAEYAALLDVEPDDSSLEDIIEHLLHWKKARVLDVVSLKSSYRTSASLDTTTLPTLTRQFQTAFPHLGPLPVLLSRLRPGEPFSSLCSVPGLRSTYFAALVWLLQRSVVDKVRTFLRIVVSEEVKNEALMHWGRRERESSVGSLSGQSDHSASTKSVFSQRSQRVDLADEGKNVPIVGLSASPSATTRKRTSTFGPTKHRTLSIATGSSVSAAPEHSTKGPSLIIEPGRPQEIESRWLVELTREKEKRVTERFERMRGCCNGRVDLDEVRWRAQLSRKDLRIVLAAFEGAIIQFSHP